MRYVILWGLALATFIGGFVLGARVDTMSAVFLDDLKQEIKKLQR